VRPPFIIQNETNFRNEIGFPIGLHDKITAGLAWSGSRDEYYQNDRFLKSDDSDKTDFNSLVTHAEYERNSQNSRQYATEGLYQNVSLRHITGVERHVPGTTAPVGQRTSRHNNSYVLFRAVSDRYWDLTRKFALGYRAEGVFSNKDNFTNYTSTLLAAPGFYPTPHSKAMYIGNFRANNFVAGGAKGIYHINSSLHLRLDGYSFVPLRKPLLLADNKAGKSKKTFSGVYWQGMAALVYETGLGPASLAVNYYDKENTRWYLTLNFGYVLFNKRGF
jgi:NTE family protein